MQPRHVFLSYRSLERAFALRLAAALNALGVQVWADCLPAGLRVGDEWPQKLGEAIDTCRCMIAVISPAYATSRVCLDELSRAKQRGRTVFPVLLEPVEPEAWPIELQRVQYEDLTAWRDPQAFSAAVDSLVARLRAGRGEVIGQRPDAEQQYLLTLIADLESRVGVARHIALAAELRELREDEQTAAIDPDAWRVDPDFYLLDAGTAGAERDEKQRRVSFDDLASLPRRFVITGAPGAGKTTTLFHLALRFARARLDDPRTNPLPVILNLPDWVREPAPEEFVASRWPIDSSVQTAIDSDDVILLFDGLNEMGPRRHANAVALREWLHGHRAPRRVVFACRERDYAELDLGIDEANVRPLDKERIRQFAAAYLRDGAPAFLERLRPLGAIANNPYLLFSLVLLHREKQELPRNMGRLFHRLTEFLWNKERLHHAPDWMPFDDARLRLSRLAFTMTEANESTRIPETLADVHLRDGFALHTALGANILDRSETGLRFFHQRIQEYFAAVELLRLGRGALTKRLSGSWFEIVIAAAGVTDEPEPFVEAVRKQDPLLAGACLASGVAVSGKLSKRIETVLAKRLHDIERKVLKKEVERYPSTPWWVVDERVSNYFGRYDSFEDLVTKVRGGEIYLREG